MTHFNISPEHADVALPLRSDVLHLRELSLADAPRTVEYLNDFEVAGNLTTVPHPYHLADAERWLNDVLKRSDTTNFAIDHTQHGFVGTVGFRHQAGDAIIGYWLGRPFWNKGIMTEALITALKWYFTVTRAEQVLSGIFHFNMASLAIQQKLGFVETGRSVTHCLARGEDVEHIDTELTRDAFELTTDNREEALQRNAKRTF